MTTTWDLFRDATLALVGTGTIKQRLTLAYRQYLYELDEDSLPREVRNDFAWLTAQVTSGRAMGELGLVEATVRKMSDADASRCAERIVDMFSMLTAEQPRVARVHGLRAIGGSG